jgi:hypothetical protein
MAPIRGARSKESVQFSDHSERKMRPSSGYFTDVRYSPVDSDISREIQVLQRDIERIKLSIASMPVTRTEPKRGLERLSLQSVEPVVSRHRFLGMLQETPADFQPSAKVEKHVSINDQQPETVDDGKSNYSLISRPFEMSQFVTDRRHERVDRQRDRRLRERDSLSSGRQRDSQTAEHDSLSVDRQRDRQLDERDSLSSDRQRDRQFVEYDAELSGLQDVAVSVDRKFVDPQLFVKRSASSFVESPVYEQDSKFVLDERGEQRGLYLQKSRVKSVAEEPSFAEEGNYDSDRTKKSAGLKSPPDLKVRRTEKSDGHKSPPDQKVRRTEKSDRIGKSAGLDSKQSDEMSTANDTETSAAVEQKNEVVPRSKNTWIKPDKFDGMTSFETFAAQFKNCCEYNRWTEADSLAHLKASLTGVAAQALWDSNANDISSLSSLLQLLRGRFGSEQQSEKFRTELRMRRRKADESLTSLFVILRD